MAFLDFFEALLGCAKLYVEETSEQQQDVPVVTSEVDQQLQQQPYVEPVISTSQQTAASQITQSVSPAEQVFLLSDSYFLLTLCFILNNSNNSNNSNP